MYADDGDMYLAFKQKEVNSTKAEMEDLAADLRDWFIANNLMSDDDKLVALVINGS